MIRALLDDVDHWCTDRRFLVRAPALVYFLWVWVHHASRPMYRSVFGGLNLGVHELGHFVFGPFGDVIGALGGSLFQCLVPLVGMGMFLRQRDYFAVTVAWGWLATNFFEVSVYAADAVVMRLPLVTPGGGHPIHDWNYILGAMGWLRYTDQVAGWIRLAGHLSMLASLAGMAYLGSRMLTLAPETPAPEKPEGGGFAARPRDFPLRPGSESDPPGTATPSHAEMSSDVRPSRRPPGAGRSPSALPPRPSPEPNPPSRSGSSSPRHSTRGR